MASTPIPPTIPSGEEIYNSLMAAIEPELTTAEIPLLPERYKKEKPADAALRAERYNVAYAAYEKAYVAYMQDLQEKVAQYRRAAFHSAEANDAAKEQDSLNSIETLMTQAS